MTRLWLSTADAARILGVTDARVRQLVADRVVDSMIVGGRHLLDEAQVQRLAGARASAKSDRPFARVARRERAKGRAASARVDRSAARGRMFSSMRELLARPGAVDLTAPSQPIAGAPTQ